jgi:hypothetical protein
VRTHLKSQLESFDLMVVRSPLLVLIACTFLTSVAAAQTPCEETFPARLAAAKADVKEWFKEDDAYRKYLRSPQGKAMTFFSEHCRFLSQLEIAIRKLDDPLSFVCDPHAGPKPKALTTRVIAESGGNVGPSIHGTDSSNASCSSEDPIDLAINSDFDDKENGAKAYLIFCHGDPRKGCQEITANARKILELYEERRTSQASR